jgi:hypothetical protein
MLLTPAPSVQSDPALSLKVIVIFGEVNAALSLIERLSRWLTRRNSLPETVAGRFVRLFEAHGVHRNQISRIMSGYGISPVHLQSDQALMPALTDEILDSAASLFAIRREWLDLASEQIYPLHDFYKQPEAFVEFVEQLRGQETATLRGIVLASTSDRHEETALVVLEQQIGAVGDRTLYRYHICHNWFFSYWKSRAYLTACIASAWKRDVNLIGREVPIGVIRKYREGNRFLEYGPDGALPTRGTPWYPEEMALKPASFLKGFDHEKNADSLGLSLWLDLEARGFMDTELPYSAVRKGFEEALGRAAPLNPLT